MPSELQTVRFKHMGGTSLYGANELDAAGEYVKADVARGMYAALEEITKGEGRFSMNPLTHASNCIEDMRAIALAALAAARGESQ